MPLLPTREKIRALSKFDEVVKYRKTTTDVIPAKAGIQEHQPITKHWTPAPAPDTDPGFAGVTTFYDVIKS
jgi:hypothetical protein